MTEKLWEALEKLAESTGVAVERLYIILEQQAKVQLAYDILLLLGIFVAIIVGIMLSKYFFKKAKADGMFSAWELPAYITSALTGALCMASIFSIIPMLIKEIVQIIINPPVWILEYVMKLIK